MKKSTYKSLLLIIGLLFTSELTLNAQTTITSMSPVSGALPGGTLITLIGSGLDSDSIVGIFFESVANPGTLVSAVTDTTHVSDTLITFKAPVINPTATSVRTYSVYIELTGDIKITSPENFEYIAPNPPVITGITPDSLHMNLADTIAIRGTSLKDVYTVNFGASGATPISVTDTLIKVLNPIINSTINVTVNVSVLAPTDSSAHNDASTFTYLNNNPDSTFTLSLTNLTGLAPKYKVYVLGYSTGFQKTLTVNSKTGSFTTIDTLVAADSTGYVTSYELGKDITAIDLSSTDSINGARIYFFVEDTTQSSSYSQVWRDHRGFEYKDFGKAVIQVANPPQDSFPNYTYIEATFLKGQGLYIDISTVDGFFFPVSILAKDEDDNELGRIGQPDSVSAEMIVNAYKPFMANLNSGNEPTAPYDSLYRYVNSDLTYLLNPGLYLANETSQLETVFDSSLNVFFTDSNLKMKLWQNGNGTFTRYYDVTPVPNHPYPETQNTHDALRFTTTNSDTLYVFNPVGFSVVSYEDSINNTRQPIMGTINDSVLTFTPYLPKNSGLSKNMFVNGGGTVVGQTLITKINTDASGNIISVNLNYANNSTDTIRYKFSKAPTDCFLSSGEMTFAGSGVFSDGVLRYTDANLQVVVNGLENQICTAFNRGVALYGFANDSITTVNWAKEDKWYPVGETQNYFSLFMHTATVVVGIDTVNIFSLPDTAVNPNNRGNMGMSYGFSYDENPMGPNVPKDSPQVPSEFPGVFPVGTESLQLILGPWITQ